MPAFAAAVPTDVEQLTPFDYRKPERGRRGRRARRRGLGDRSAAGGRALPIRPAGDSLGRRARAAAADVPRPRRPVVDGRVRRMGSAVRRGRGPRRARGDSRPRSSSARPNERRSTSTRSPPWVSSWSAVGGRPRRPGAVLRRAAKRVLARRPQAGPSARRLRRVGRDRAGATTTSSRPSASHPPRCRRRPGSGSTSAAARSARSSGLRAFGPTTAGSTFRWSTRRASSATTAASVDSPGMYALGLPVLRRRKSTFIPGIEDDAREVVRHLNVHLADTAPSALAR